MYTYFPPFLLTLLHPLHNFLTELRTFMPRICCSAIRLLAGVCVRDGLALRWRRWKADVRENWVVLAPSCLAGIDEKLALGMQCRRSVEKRGMRVWKLRRKPCRAMILEASISVRGSACVVCVLSVLAAMDLLWYLRELQWAS